MIEDILPDLIVLTSHQENSAAPITRTFDANINATKPKNCSW